MALLVRLSVSSRAYDFLAAITCTLTLICSCDGSLTVKPINIEAVIGQRVQLNCSTSEQYYVLWDHASVGSASRNYVFFSDVLILPYSKRFQLVRDDATGAYNLVIPSVQKEDAGNYRCMDMAGHGEQAEAELIVLDSEPQCEADVIRFCGRTSQDIQSTCTIGFRGNIVPEVECSSNGVTTSSSVVKEQMQDSVTYNLPLTAHWSHPTVCRTSISHVSSIVDTTVMYAFRSTETLDHHKAGGAHCIANSSEHCSYRWIKSDTNAVISSNQTLTTAEPGHYTCEAECMMQDQMCKVTALVVNLATQESVFNTEEKTVDNDMKTTGFVIGVSVGIICICVIVVAGILVTFCCIKRGRRKWSEDHEAANPCLGQDLTSSQATSSNQEQQHQHSNGNGHVTSNLACSNTSQVGIH